MLKPIYFYWYTQNLKYVNYIVLNFQGSNLKIKTYTKKQLYELTNSKILMF